MSATDPIDRDLASPRPPVGLEGRVREAVGEIRPVTPRLSPARRAALVTGAAAVVLVAAGSGSGSVDGRVPGAVAMLLLAAGGVWLAMALAVPGSSVPRRASIAWLALPLVFAAAVAAALGLSGPVAGVPCLLSGLAVAALPFLAAAVLVFRAFPLAPARTGAVAGVSAGAFGLALLHLTCPIVQGPHLAVFHGAVLLVPLLLGGAAGLATRLAR